MDSVFIEKVLSGDIDTFKYFVSKYKDFAISLSYAILKDKYLSEEAVQKSFIKAFEKLNTFKQHASFKTWFGRIIINESLSEVANCRKNTSLENISELEIVEVEYLLSNMIQKERQFIISKVFKKLTYDESLVLELYYLKEFTINEICEMTEWSQSKVKMLNLRGRRNFYHQMKIMLKHEMKDVI